MAVIYNFPPRAAFGKIIPKSRIYSHINVSSRVKKMFATEVERIRWAYKLAPETINLPEKDGISEIQVFEIELRTDDLHYEVLKVIDRAIPTPILFVLKNSNQQIRYVAAYKRLSLSDSHKWVTGEYFETEWMDENSNERVALPVVIDMAMLYQCLLENVMPFSLRAGEDMQQFVERGERFLALSREADRLRHRLQRERQFNRKVEINRKLKIIIKEMEQLGEQAA